jgi:3-oxoadipate enol-lactonase
MNSFTPQHFKPWSPVRTPHLLEISRLPPARRLQRRLSHIVAPVRDSGSHPPQIRFAAAGRHPMPAVPSNIRVAGDHDSDIGPIVLINGLLQTADSWKSLVDILKPFAQVISYDLRFQGPSSTATELPESDNCHVSDLVTLLDFLGIEKPTLIGQSFGARVALDFALRHPGRVERLVLLAPHSPVVAERYRMIINTWQQVLPDSEHGDWLPFARAVCPWVFGAKYLAARPTFLEAYAKHIAAAHRPAGVRANLQVLHRAHDRERVSYYESEQSTVPALVINGEDDYLTPPGVLPAAMRVLPRATLILLPNCGHAVTEEAGYEAERRIMDFLLDQ